MQVYYANHAFSAAMGGADDEGVQFFTDDFRALAPFATMPGALDGECWRGGSPPIIQVSEGGDTFVAKVSLDGFIATVDNRRFLQVEQL
jgi:hypothetical protein